METLTAGETFSVERVIDDATEAILRIGGPKASSHEMTSEAGQMWKVNVDTDTYPPGRYEVEILATLEGGIKRVRYRSNFIVRRAPGVGEVRSEAQIALDNIRSMLAGQAKEGVRRYRINNRELERYTIAELKELESYWASKVRAENRKNSGKSGLGPKILVHF